MLVDRYSDFYNGQFGGYTLTNENPNIVGRLVRELMPNNMLAVAGGGECLFFGPVSQGVRTHGVDRAFNSNLATLTKGTILEHYGSGTKRIIARGEEYFWNTVEGEVFPYIPKFLMERLSEPRTGKAIPPRKAIQMGAWSFEKFSDVWTSVPDYIMDAARDNMGCLSLAYADIYEIHGCYDVVNMSNVPTFAGNKMDMEWLQRTIRPSGHLIVTQPPGDPSLNLPGFTITWSETEPGSMRWTYNVYQLAVQPALADAR